MGRRRLEGGEGEKNRKKNPTKLNNLKKKNPNSQTKEEYHLDCESMETKKIC